MSDFGSEQLSAHISVEIRRTRTKEGRIVARAHALSEIEQFKDAKIIGQKHIIAADNFAKRFAQIPFFPKAVGVDLERIAIDDFGLKEPEWNEKQLEAWNEIRTILGFCGPNYEMVLWCVIGQGLRLKDFGLMYHKQHPVDHLKNALQRLADYYGL